MAYDFQVFQSELYLNIFRGLCFVGESTRDRKGQSVWRHLRNSQPEDFHFRRVTRD